MAEDGGDRDHQQQQQQQQAAAGGAGAGVAPGEARGRESVKLFVGQVPKQMTESELAAMFSRVALVDEVTVIRDRATRVSRGNGSVRLTSHPTSARGLPPPPPLRTLRQCDSRAGWGGFPRRGIWAAGRCGGDGASGLRRPYVAFLFLGGEDFVALGGALS
jgi:hypothetical protein